VKADGWAVLEALGDDAEHVACGDVLAAPDGRGHRQVCGAQVSRVRDRHDAATRHRAGEGDDPWARRVYGIAGVGGEVDSPMPGQPLLRGLIEVSDDAGP
jgi:hypothetical protein